MEPFTSLLARQPTAAGGLAVAGVCCWLGICLAVRSVVDEAHVTAATWVTIARGAVGGGLLGWVFLPANGSLAWLSALLFAVAGLLDAVDGPIARRTETVSDFGARLDTEADGLVVLVGSVLLVSNAVAPTWFLLVGCARYIYVAGCWLRRVRGGKLGDDDSPVAAVIYAGAMTAMWISLVPVTTSELTDPLLTVAGLLVLGSFLRSWLVVTGRISSPTPGTGA